MSQNNRRSIQDIVPPARSMPVRPRPSRVETSTETNSQKLPLKPKRVEKTTGMFGLLGISLGIILLIGTAFGIVSTVFHRAELTITPYAFLVPIAETFIVSLNDENLGYRTITYETIESRDVPSSSSQFTEDRAQGIITIFNEYSTQPQRLITNTRFQAENGRIYRIESPVTIPGYTIVSGQIIPGTVNVTVYADELGDAYNTDATSFTIPGLLGSPQFEDIYARTTSGIRGGFVGQKPIVEESVRTTALEELKSEIDRNVRAQLLERLSPDQFFIGELVAVEFVEQPDTPTENGARITVQGIASVPAFSETQVARRIAESEGVVFNAPLLISNWDDVMFEASRDAEESNQINLTVSGDVQLIAQINTESFIRDIVGSQQESIGAVIGRYPGIQDLNVSIFPFWRQTLPNDASRFTVTFEN